MARQWKTRPLTRTKQKDALAMRQHDLSVIGKRRPEACSGKGEATEEGRDQWVFVQRRHHRN